MSRVPRAGQCRGLFMALIVALGGCVRAGFDDVDGGPVGRDGASDAPQVTDAPLPDLLGADLASDAGSVVPGTWVLIPGGTFTMGSPAAEACRFTNESRHQVTLTRSFILQSTEVTQAQFSSLMGHNPASFKSCGPDCPVESVTWHEAAPDPGAHQGARGAARARRTRVYQPRACGVSQVQSSGYTGANCSNTSVDPR